jgi:hypothetical protein
MAERANNNCDDCGLNEKEPVSPTLYESTMKFFSIQEIPLLNPLISLCSKIHHFSFNSPVLSRVRFDWKLDALNKTILSFTFSNCMPFPNSMSGSGSFRWLER